MRYSATPIETYYGGMRFRSRLEARWAIFFDRMDIPFKYEPQGFVLPDGTPYLPDFYLPECGTWIEVKGSDSTLNLPMMRRAASALPSEGREELHGPCVKHEGGIGLLILGDIPHLADDDWEEPAWHTPFAASADDFDVVFTYTFGMYYKNHRPWFAGDGAKTPPSTHPEFGHGEPLDERTRTAYVAARTARFEHGQTPRPPKRLARLGHRRHDRCPSCHAQGHTA